MASHACCYNLSSAAFSSSPALRAWIFARQSWYDLLFAAKEREDEGLNEFFVELSVSETALSSALTLLSMDLFLVKGMDMGSFLKF